MKRIISQITLVALIATTVAPVAQAAQLTPAEIVAAAPRTGNWIANGFRLFAKDVGNNIGTAFPYIAGTIAGIGAVGYQYFCKAKIRKEQEDFKKELAEYEKLQKEINSLTAMHSRLPVVPAADFSQLAEDDQKALAQTKDAYLKTQDPKALEQAEAAKAFRTALEERIKTKTEARNKAFPNGTPVQPAINVACFFGKVAGVIGGSVLGMILTGHLSYAHRLSKYYASDYRITPR